MGATPTTTASTTTATTTKPTALVVVLALLAVITFVARAAVLSTTNVNWDEFYFLSRVFEHDRGELSARLLTFHVHLLSFVPHVVTDTIDQVLVIRVVMLGVGVAGAACLGVVASRVHGSVVAGAFVVVVAAGFSFVAHHGVAARFDPPVAALFALSAALLVVGGRRQQLAAAVAFALALLISIKAVLLLPSLLAVLLFGPVSTSWREVVRFVVVLGVIFAVGFVGHAATLAPVAVVDAVAVVDTADDPVAIARKVFLDAGPSQWRTLRRSLVVDAVFWGLVVAGLVVAGWRARGGRDERRRFIVVVAWALPVLALALYRNAFAYFYVTIVPALALSTGSVVVAIEQRLPRRPVIAAVIVVGLAVPSVAMTVRWSLRHTDDVSHQRSIIDGVRAVFSTPVPYVDRCSMIADFQKVGPFMSTWGLERYRAAGRAEVAALLDDDAPPLFVLANTPALELHRTADEMKRRPQRLLDDDIVALRANYLPWWGPVWIAGRAVVVAGGGTEAFVNAIAGPYVLRTPRALRIDDVAYDDGATVVLDRGDHRIGFVDVGAGATITLHTAHAAAPPTTAPPTRPIFVPLNPRD